VRQGQLPAPCRFTLPYHAGRRLDQTGRHDVEPPRTTDEGKRESMIVHGLRTRIAVRQQTWRLAQIEGSINQQQLMEAQRVQVGLVCSTPCSRFAGRRAVAKQLAEMARLSERWEIASHVADERHSRSSWDRFAEVAAGNAEAIESVVHGSSLPSGEAQPKPATPDGA